MTNLSIYEFAKTINTYGNRYTYSHNENVVIIYPNIDEKDKSRSEEYYRQQCILQIPFRISIKDFFDSHGNSEDDTWFAFFESQNLSILNTDRTYNNDVELEDETNEDNDATNYNAFEKLSAAKVEKVDEQLGHRIIDRAYDWTNNDQKVSTVPEIVNFLQSYKNENFENEKIYTIDNFTSSKEQGEVLKLCRQQIQLVKNVNIGRSDIIKRVIVQGKAGAGKSTIIKKIEQK